MFHGVDSFQFKVKIKFKERIFLRALNIVSEMANGLLVKESE